MSAWEEKMAPQDHAYSSRARCSLKQLRVRWGELEELRGQDLLRLKGMDPRPEVWRRLTGRGDSATYEMVTDEGIEPEQQQT